MTVRITRILSSPEFLSLCDKVVAEGYYRNDKRIFVPGMAWEMDWVFDPTGRRQAAGQNVMIKSSNSPNRGHLSEYYWKDWSNNRPPLCIVCPDGSFWECDRRSSNGPGWVVAGKFPAITCSPSIVVPGYHGFLRNGVFSEDLEGRGPYGSVTSPEGSKACNQMPPLM